MKIVSATPKTPGMTKEEVDRFLESKLMLQMSTIDEQGEPNIQPVWFYYDKNRKIVVVIGYSFRDESINNVFWNRFFIETKETDEFKMLICTKSKEVQDRVRMIFKNENITKITATYCSYWFLVHFVTFSWPQSAQRSHHVHEECFVHFVYIVFSQP